VRRAKIALNERKILVSDLRLNAQQIQLLGSLVGVDIDDAQAANLVSQAEPHFALMQSLDGFDTGGVEPAAEFRLESVEN